MTASGGTASGKTGPGRTCPGRTGRRPVGPGEIGRMDFERFFAKEMAGLKAEGRYRIFADLERRAGDFPHAMRHGPGGRSEEHTSELQSLMRISYAVFCLTKNKRRTQCQRQQVHSIGREPIKYSQG